MILGWERLSHLVVVLGVFALGACGSGSEPAPPGTAPVVVFLGDSLTAGPMLDPGQTYPALLAARFLREGRPIAVTNAGVSGDETADGLRRLDGVLALRPDVVVVGLGANDGLRGRPSARAESNLRTVVQRVRDTGADVLLLGVRLPGVVGPEAVDYAPMYERLADELGVVLVPDLLDGVAGRADLNLEDRMHPNEKGHAVMAATVAPHLEKVLRRRAGRASAGGGRA